MESILRWQCYIITKAAKFVIPAKAGIQCNDYSVAAVPNTAVTWLDK